MMKQKMRKVRKKMKTKIMRRSSRLKIWAQIRRKIVLRLTKTK